MSASAETSPTDVTNGEVVSPKDVRLGFLAYVELSEEGTYRGALLVTDGHCKPVEFRCTSPIRPNKVQTLLYGSTLMPCIGLDLVASPLLASVSNSPSVVLVASPVLLDARTGTDTPVLYVRRQGDAIHLAGDGDEASASGDLVESASDRFQAIVLTPHWEHADDLNTWRDRLSQLFAHVDLLEPFERITHALEVVHEQHVLDTE